MTHHNKNRVVERRIMAQANRYIKFSRDVVLATTYILNQVPSKSVLYTPYELWTSVKANFEIWVGVNG